MTPDVNKPLPPEEHTTASVVGQLIAMAVARSSSMLISTVNSRGRYEI